MVFPLILPLPALRHSSQIRWLLFYSGGNSQANNFEAWVLSMKRTLTALTVAVTMFASGVSASDPDDLQKLKETNECIDCDLSLANLIGADLWRADLRGADLSNATLSGANLLSATMNGAILCNTIMPDGSVIYSGC